MISLVARNTRQCHKIRDANLETSVDGAAQPFINPPSPVAANVSKLDRQELHQKLQPYVAIPTFPSTANNQQRGASKISIREKRKSGPAYSSDGGNWAKGQNIQCNHWHIYSEVNV